MFEPADRPRLFGVAPGVDFPAALVAGLRTRLHGQPPEAMARVQLIVNTRRMARRIRALFDQGPACLLPRIGLVTDLGERWDMAHIPPAVPALRRRLELIRLISALLDQQPDLAPRTSLYDLADSLAALMDEMQGEGVSPEVIGDLDVSDQSGHWARIRAFLDIVTHFDRDTARPGLETRQRRVIEHLTTLWQERPPAHPVILAGSTGSRGATHLLMRAVARLPQGAVVLPGYDFDMPDAVWDTLGDGLTSEDHPQYRFHMLRRGLDPGPEDVAHWAEIRPANPARNRLISLALRPAPITDQWLRDGPLLRDLDEAMRDVTLLEAPSQRIEALSIAMRLRQAADDGQTAALITPDRTLTRQVAAALDRWQIVPDDSAGQPLHLSPPGRFLRHVGALFGQRLTAEALLTLLKHPITHSGGARGTHLRLTRELELHLRAKGPPYPDAAYIAGWAAGQSDPLAPPWAAWLTGCLVGQDDAGDRPLADRVSAHVTLAERIADGCATDGTHKLWSQEAGREARKVVDSLAKEAPYGGAFNAADYASLIHALLSRGEVRSATEPNPGILIWGTLEARVQGADLLILGGLNEGSWPEAPDPDPWLNRALRHQAGLLLPERRIGLSAHDFQQAVSAAEVWITRALKSDEAETVASRWLNRVQNLLTGLPDQGGPAALEAARDRGRDWLRRAAALETVTPVTPASRPAPCPPVSIRPAQLSVTEIRRLIRDPYAIYARHVLRLRPLDPLMQVPDALLRGIVLHDVLERFIRDSRDDDTECSAARLMEITETVLADNVPWAEARAIWLARIERVADWFVESELARRNLARPTAFEARGKLVLSDPPFTLTAKADRIDLDENGHLHLYDYKTGAPPSKKEQAHFDKQLLLEAAIAEQSGFGDLAPGRVMRAVYIGLGGEGRELPAPLDDEPPAKVRAELAALIAAYRDPAQGYAARRAMQRKADVGEYDQLARFGEWDITDPARRIRLP